MNKRAVGYELAVFVTQWGLMLLGFGILTKFVAPLSLLNLSLSLGLYFDAAIKGLVALALSMTWLFIWDRQVRLYFHGRGK
jgi:peroxiredoxin family protein